MEDTDRLRNACERNLRILTAKPHKGRLTATTRASIESGLRCVISEGDWQLTTDMPARLGGDDTGPTPGTFGRGALASCLAMGIKMWAARLEVWVDHVEVVVEADFDARGEVGLDGVRAGYEAVRRRISIESDAPPESVMRVVELAERHSPYLDVFASPLSMGRQVDVHSKEA